MVEGSVTLPFVGGSRLSVLVGAGAGLVAVLGVAFCLCAAVRARGTTRQPNFPLGFVLVVFVAYGAAMVAAGVLLLLWGLSSDAMERAEAVRELVDPSAPESWAFEMIELAQIGGGVALGHAAITPLAGTGCWWIVGLGMLAQCIMTGILVFQRGLILVQPEDDGLLAEVTPLLLAGLPLTAVVAALGCCSACAASAGRVHRLPEADVTEFREYRRSVRLSYRQASKAASVHSTTSDHRDSISTRASGSSDGLDERLERRPPPEERRLSVRVSTIVTPELDESTV